MYIERKNLYDELTELARSAPTYQFEGNVPNNNSIWIKDFTQVDELGANHYALVILELLRSFEDAGRIAPGDRIIETTSGSTGISLVKVSEQLGYKCEIVVPEGIEQARIEQLEGAEVHYTPEADYVNGFPSFLKTYLVEQKKNGQLITYLGHAQGKRGGINSVTVGAFFTYMQDCICDLADRGVRVDTFVGAVGNGSSLLGVQRAFMGSARKIIGVEPFQSALAYDRLWPNVYEQEYGIKPGELPRHTLPGLSYWKDGTKVPTPHLDVVISSGALKEVRLVKDPQTDQHYEERGGDISLLEHLLDWSTIEPNGFGRSTRACLGSALRYAKTTSDENILIWAYDGADRYDSDL